MLMREPSWSTPRHHRISQCSTVWARIAPYLVYVRVMLGLWPVWTVVWTLLRLFWLGWFIAAPTLSTTVGVLWFMLCAIAIFLRMVCKWLNALAAEPDQDKRPSIWGDPDTNVWGDASSSVHTTNSENNIRPAARAEPLEPQPQKRIELASTAQPGPQMDPQPVAQERVTTVPSTPAEPQTALDLSEVLAEASEQMPDTLSYKQLQALAKQLGLPATGKIAVLRARIEAELSPAQHSQSNVSTDASRPDLQAQQKLEPPEDAGVAASTTVSTVTESSHHSFSGTAPKAAPPLKTSKRKKLYKPTFEGKPPATEDAGFALFTDKHGESYAAESGTRAQGADRHQQKKKKHQEHQQQQNEALAAGVAAAQHRLGNATAEAKRVAGAKALNQQAAADAAKQRRLEKRTRKQQQLQEQKPADATDDALHKQEEAKDAMSTRRTQRAAIEEAVPPSPGTATSIIRDV